MVANIYLFVSSLRMSNATQYYILNHQCTEGGFLPQIIHFKQDNERCFVSRWTSAEIIFNLFLCRICSSLPSSCFLFLYILHRPICALYCSTFRSPPHTKCLPYHFETCFSSEEIRLVKFP